MIKQYTSTGNSPEAVIWGRGMSLHTFWFKAQGFSSIWKEVLGTLVLVGIFGYALFSVIQSINFLGIDFFLRERKESLFGALVSIIFLVFWIYHLKKVLTTKAEVFAKGFYLKHGRKEYAYEFKDLAHLQKAFFRGGNNQINSVILALHLGNGEQIKIAESWTDVLINFADAVTSVYAQWKKEGVLEQLKKGEKIWFWLLELDQHFVYFDEKQVSRNEISEIKKARADRYLLVYDLKDKKIAKWDLNKIRDEELFMILLETVGKKVV